MQSSESAFVHRQAAVQHPGVRVWRCVMSRRHASAALSIGQWRSGAATTKRDLDPESAVLSKKKEKNRADTQNRTMPTCNDALPYAPYTISFIVF